MISPINRDFPVASPQIDDAKRREERLSVIRFHAVDQRTVFLLLFLLLISTAINGFFTGTTNSIQQISSRELKYRVNLNEASESELRQIPGIGETLAGRIIEYREKTSPFESVADLKKIQGIGKKKYLDAEPFVYIEKIKKSK
ncbi:MAG: helix-hairpin-helix domain-containing protein [Planctomycetaceae bacterium]|jgi:competence ComEA-like helix-hairpin-helix protein|nr:helix-hairpin-helix domain-containing protein [Planctomycetaceae bacterium]